ncbi:ABC-F family ATP-binding cassette domain-containing protein [Limoniibacter endophyticus]|uniref:ABC transporter n=1 Tax=Limoniibacter endophyticus TaxID=1565040 RepID=A0A8J3DRF1_9HYPH|nr:ABC-F family ATP-binding cassette domain-containing protein [Limoniibacter endophyticus]GHC69367.1 ABC transporter [Limoniibacter endophyticus]
MPASITLSRLTWSTPDGTALFSDLDLSFGLERVGIVGRNGTGKTTLLRLIRGDLSPASGTVSRSGSIGLMRQDIGQNPAETVADLFEARDALALLARAEAGQATVEELAEADWALPARLDTALARLGLAPLPETCLCSLSGGQRARMGLAALTFSGPDFLLLDEPTNNLDREGRKAVVELIRNWRGGAIIVSHDRELLDEMDAIVELTSLGVSRYSGNYTTYRERKAQELTAARENLAQAEKMTNAVAARAQEAAERKARKDNAGRRSRTKGDQPKILMDFAKGRSENTSGANARLRDARRTEAQFVLDTARQKIEILEPLHMQIASTGLSAEKRVLRLDRITGGYDLASPVIRDFSLVLTGPKRVALNGPNGSGKSTLLALIAGRLTPVCGQVECFVPLAFLDQHVALLDPALSLHDNFRALDPSADENQCRAALARFRFRADDAMRVAGSLSGGERLRAGLACTLGQKKPPQLLILDEPTNHLDLDALEALESALTSYDGALLVVSHDQAFLDTLRLDTVENIVASPTG